MSLTNKTAIMRFIIFFIGLVTFFSTAAQKDRVMPIPSRFHTPVYKTGDEYKAFLRANRSDKPFSRDVFWYVWADREGVVVRDKPNPGGNSVGRLEFGEIYLVLDETEEWIQLSSFEVEPQKNRTSEKDRKLGWVLKTDVLLWQQALKDGSTNILKKTFLLNTKEYYERNQFNEGRDQVELRRGPGFTSSPIRSISIYGFYFVFKIEMVGNTEFYLLGSDYSYHHGSKDRILLGWVEGSRCTNWDSRLCFEPNFLDAAMKERSENKQKLALRGFLTAKEVIDYLKSGLGSGTPLWEGDPILRQSSREGLLIKQVINKEERYRWPGSILRIPLIGFPQQVNNDPKMVFISSGIAGEIAPLTVSQHLSRLDVDTYGSLERRVRQIMAEDRNYKAIFLIEAHPATERWVKDSLSSMLNAIKGSLPLDVQRFSMGAVVYKDNMEQDAVQTFSPDPEPIKVINAVKNLPFRSVSDIDTDDGTSLFRALESALKMCNPDEVNLFILIGRNANYTFARSERSELNNTKMIELLNGINPSIMCISDHDSQVDFTLEDNMRALMTNAAIDYYQWYASLQRSVENQYPFIEEPVFKAGRSSGKNEVQYLQSFVFGKLLSPAGNKLDLSNINQQLAAFVEMVTKQRDFNSQALQSSILFGKSAQEAFVAADGFTSAAFGSLRKPLERFSDPRDLATISREKIKLYLPANFPYKTSAAKHPLLSTILFMPEPELVSYIDDLERVIDQFESRISAKEKAKALADAYCDLYYRLVGEESMGRRRPDCNTVSLLELRQRLHGLSTGANDLDDFYFGEAWGLGRNFTIDDIRNLQDNSLNGIRDKLADVVRYLNINVRNNQDFIYEAGSTGFNSRNRYYWIPITDAF